MKATKGRFDYGQTPEEGDAEKLEEKWENNWTVYFQKLSSIYDFIKH